MSEIPIYKGRKINRFLCVTFACLCAAALAASGTAWLLGDTGIRSVCVIFAQITGAFALLYGVLWAVWARKENKAEQKLRAQNEARPAPREADGTGCREFVLPREKLTGAARRRFVSVIKGTALAALGVFALITLITLWGGVFGSPVRLLYILLFACAICVPGILAQWGIYRKFALDVPGRIALYPGRLEVDDSVFTAGEILDIRISPDRIYNADSPAVFRGMAVRTARGVKRCRMDFCSGRASKDGVCWEGYSEFSAALQSWGKAAGVTVTVEYME
ncbi:MAG: hypothetical protein IKI24_02535 [Clostridia bacterium]|nr:hypothetical protein [Clostridia bacterium]